MSTREAFIVGTGRPTSMDRAERQINWLTFAREYAVERRLLTENPITALPRRAPQVAHAVDRRVVVNPAQARTLLDAVAEEKPSGDRLVAFFGTMYYAALRPAEALMLRKVNLALPAECWGELLLESSSPVAGPAWTDSGRRPAVPRRAQRRDVREHVLPRLAQGPRRRAVAR